MRLLVVLFFLFNFSFADSFKEIRYSDALQKSHELHGEIVFDKFGIKIDYDGGESIVYDELMGVELYKDKKELDLDDFQKQKLASFLDILILLHSNDRTLIEENFDLTNKDGLEILVPKYDTKKYLSKIILKREQEKLSFIKLFFQNNDTITIEIANEIH